MPQTISFSQAKNMTLDYLRSWESHQSLAEKSAPIISLDWKVWSVAEMARQVQMGSDVGQRYIHFYVSSLKTYTIASYG